MNSTNIARNTVKVVFFALVFLLNTSLVHAENTTGGRAVVEVLNSQWNRAFNNGDPSSVAALYHEEAMLSPGNGEVLVGRDAIEGLFRSFIENGVHDHAIEIIDVYQDGNLMYEIAKWSAYGQESEGSRPAFGGILVNVFEADSNGEWKSRLHIWNASE